MYQKIGHKKLGPSLQKLQRGKGWKMQKERVRNQENSVKRSTVHLLEIPETEEREYDISNILKDYG